MTPPPGTDWLQGALDELAAAGGGELVVPAGTHRTGPLTLCSNLTLTLEEGAVILFDDDPTRYPPVWTRWEGVECWAMHPLLYADGVTNVTIRGAGAIDGNGRSWWRRFAAIEAEDRTTPREPWELELARLNPDHASRTGGGARPSTQFLRPPLVQFWKSSQLVIEGITLRNSPFWTLHTVYCSEVAIRGITVFNPADAINTDAVDLDSTAGVTVTDSLFDVGDDAITLKSGSGPDGLRVGLPTERVTVRNCTILASHGGIAIGSETAGGIRGVDVADCRFEGTQRAVRLKSRRGRGGTIEGITLRNLSMDGCWCPIVLGMYFAPGVLPHEEATLLDPGPQPVAATTPHIRDVVIEGVRATNVRSTAAFIVGLPEAPITDVTISDFAWSLAPDDQLLETWHTEPTKGLFHDADRGIKTINVAGLVINGEPRVTR